MERGSGSGRFGKRLIFFFLLVSFFTSLQAFSSNLYFMNPVFYCEDSDQKVS